MKSRPITDGIRKTLELLAFEDPGSPESVDHVLSAFTLSVDDFVRTWRESLADGSYAAYRKELER